MPEITKPAVSGASLAALVDLPLPRRKTHADMIEAAIADAMRKGAQNLTRKEARERVARMFMDETGRPLWLEMNVFCARVGDLIAAGRVLADKDIMRVCAVSGRMVETIRVPLAQADLPV